MFGQPILFSLLNVSVLLLFYVLIFTLLGCRFLLYTLLFSP